MQNAEGVGVGQIEEFLRGAEVVSFRGESRVEIYAWVQETLTRQEYLGQGKKQRGVIREYISKITGKSRAQITRLIRQYAETGKVRPQGQRRHRFATRYKEADIALLAEVDRAHERLSGPATRRIVQREWETFGRSQFQRLARISVSHIYNLRQRESYRRRSSYFEKTRPTHISIGERRQPNPRGQPGYVRVDTVHQGDADDSRGLYHINTVDEVTQWEVIGCTERISEQWLIPVLEAILHQYPFRIRGFHADNGSEFINHVVAGLLNKLLVGEFTRSRPHRSQDNALVEGKNGAVIRKHIGYGHIPAEHAARIHRFYAAYFNPYLNYHRPCAFATLLTNARGKRRRIYRPADYRTPYEKLRSLPHAALSLKAGISWELLDLFASRMSDTQCAHQMRQAKAKLLERCKTEWPHPPVR